MNLRLFRCFFWHEFTCYRWRLWMIYKDLSQDAQTIVVILMTISCRNWPIHQSLYVVGLPWLWSFFHLHNKQTPSPPPFLLVLRALTLPHSRQNLKLATHHHILSYSISQMMMKTRTPPAATTPYSDSPLHTRPTCCLLGNIKKFLESYRNLLQSVWILCHQNRHRLVPGPIGRLSLVAPGCINWKRHHLRRVQLLQFYKRPRSLWLRMEKFLERPKRVLYQG